MLWSRNSFFKQEDIKLEEGKLNLEVLLYIKGRSREDINAYLRAYEYFRLNPSQFDGATVVKDLVDVRLGDNYLDADAMLHDFEYVAMKANKSFRKRYKSDLKYIKNMEKNGKGIRVFRFFLLNVVGVPFVIYKKLSKG